MASTTSPSLCGSYGSGKRIISPPPSYGKAGGQSLSILAEALVIFRRSLSSYIPPNRTPSL